MTDLSKEDVNEIDRNARAFGWEIGRGRPLAKELDGLSLANPFLDPDWRDNVPDEPEEESPWVLHARRELALIGNDKDFDESIIAAVRCIASYGHSGGSAPVAIGLLNDLLQYKNIMPLTNEPATWNNVSDSSGDPMWQSCRNPEAFSEDGGVTYYLLSECQNGKKVIHEAAEWDIPEEQDSQPEDGG